MQDLNTKKHPLVSVNLVVHNHGPWLTRALDSIKTQSYENIEINQFDGTTDNIGFWAGQEKLLAQSKGEYIICMSDVVLDKNFIKNAVEVLEKDMGIGALQAKILQSNGMIDTTGFEKYKSRKIINRGKQTNNEYPEGEIFAVEGAVPVFRKKALEDCIVDGHLIDPDFRIGPLGYGDDLDLTWRMKNLGWKQWYAPGVIAYHDRSTSGPRASIPILKRQLDWCNVRFAIIKNDAILSLVKDAPFWFVREIAVFCYTILFEPKVFAIMPRFFTLLPCMLSRRKLNMNRTRSFVPAHQS